jgi:hydroxypyruvate reductase
MESTKKLVQYLQNCEPKDIVFCLISGGGSSLMTLPAEGIHLSDIQALTRELLACGADIGEINTIRKHLDRVKGGGLARLNRAAHLITLILSDVIDSPLDVIASGPTVADNSSFQDAMDIITKYALENKISTNILRILQAGIIGEIPETVKENDPSLQQVNNILIGNNQISARAALEKAREFGFTSLVLTTSLRGEASHAGMILASILQEIAENSQPVSRPACLIFGGETTVTIRGTGLGGRNLEMALGAVEQLKGFENIAFITLATDGEDGSSGAAGAVVTGGTYNAGADLGYLPTDYLKANDSYHYFEKVGGLLITGSTGTNVNDLGFLFAF